MSHMLICKSCGGEFWSGNHHDCPGVFAARDTQGAEPKLTPFNINFYVRVKVTEIGIAILRVQHEQLDGYWRKTTPFEPPETDAEGWSRWQMHDLMSRFGEHLSVGLQVPFEPNILLEAEGW